MYNTEMYVVLFVLIAIIRKSSCDHRLSTYVPIRAILFAFASLESSGTRS